MYTYAERKTPNQRTYTLDGDHVLVQGKQGFGRFAIIAHLPDLAPHVQRITAHHQGVKRVAKYLAVVVAATWIALRLNAPTYIALGIGSFLLVPGLMAFYQVYRPLDIVQFRSHAGIVVFDIVRERSQAMACDEFVELVRTAIADAQKNGPANQAPDPTAPSVTPPAAQEARH